MRTIGASFSGGGFRAAAFTMGSLSYLDRLRFEDRTLLERIAYSSSTSGGSIAMALHALRSYQGQAFPAILTEAREKMSGDALLTKAMAILNDASAWARYPTKNRNLINAFAIAYHEHLYDEATLGFLCDKQNGPPIARYCFNTTEVKHGISFRFDLSGDAAWIGDVGNHWQRFAPGKQSVLDQVRLGDVAACSSCFPVGFEPMVFPDDLEHTTPIGLRDALVDENGDPLDADDLPFGIIDGGAVDNQGLYALSIEDDRRKGRGEAPFDLLLICDVSSFFADPYAPPAKASAWGNGLRLGALPWLALLCVAGLVVGEALALARHQFLIAAVLLPTLALSLYGLAKALRLLLGQGDGSWRVMLRKFGLPLLRRLSFPTFRYLLVPRVRILGMLLNNVFMNQIRRQGYGSIYDERGADGTVAACLIHELATKNTANRARRMASKRRAAERAGHAALWDAAVKPLAPTPALQAIADSASSMATTLWFDQDNMHKLDDIIACGQFTMCYTLLLHLAEREARLGRLEQPYEELRAVLLKDREAFSTRPKHLL